ncbi:hypothetical protein M422DRAFT_275192 [Sphaerobolus stellatus SS14]|uniref:Uncharacterized protein n=1 Tax=Sphaerobolus stellatus (strain SS14) TaxID=990650 RepID=A0A0C9TQ82_SPHS4|nr:hypothetical protein M422DRAFT_275192 [Sphaerobolus stellatus SS14]
MSHHCGPRRTQAEELSVADIEDSEPTTGLTTGDLSNSPSPSVDPQQSPRMLPSEHLDDPHATAYGSQTAPSREQSPSRGDVCPHTALQGLSPSRLAGASGTAHRGSHTPPRVASITATQGCYSPRGITHRSESRSNSGQVSPTGGDTMEDFVIREFITLKDNAEIVLAEAMEATERLNTVFNRVRASMSRMSLRMKELFSVPSNQASGKTLEPGNNRAHDKAATQAATQHIIAQTSMIDPAPSSGADECTRTMRSRVPGDRYSRAPLSRNIPEDIPHSARDEQGEDSQPRRGCEAHTVYARDTPKVRVRDTSCVRLARDIRVTECTRCEPANVPTHDRPEPQSIDMNALREEIKAMISATIKDKLRSDADSVTTVSQSMQALDANAQYWSDLMEEKVNNLLHEEAPEEVLLEAAREVRSIQFQLDQSSRLCEAGLMPEQQVQLSANTGRNITSPSRNYGPNPIIEPHIPQTEQMVRQVLQNASLEDEPEKSFLAKAGVKMGNPPTYGGECKLEKFENWVASILRFMSMYNLLGPQASKIQLQLLGQCLTDEAQEWFYRQVE